MKNEIQGGKAPLETEEEFERRINNDIINYTISKIRMLKAWEDVDFTGIMSSTAFSCIKKGDKDKKNLVGIRTFVEKFATKDLGRAKNKLVEQLTGVVKDLIKEDKLTKK